MFSFHKPKVYRSTTGCCICKAKSSSSRFTDSKKYEVDFIECFQLDVPRRGEICNACVLLVKRFKRLPPGSERHWGHVVDARVGPGLKSMTKFKKRKEEQKMQTDVTNGEKGAISVPERFCKIFKKKKKLRNPNDMLQIDIKKDVSSDDNLSPNSPASNSSDFDEITVNGNRGHNFRMAARKYQRKNPNPVKNRQRIVNDPAEFIDAEFWQKRQTCCGFVYENRVYGALIVDMDSFRPCVKHKPVPMKTNSPKKTEISIPHPHITTNGAVKVSNGVSKIVKVSDLFNTNTSAVKKHHLYSNSKRLAESAAAAAAVAAGNGALQPQQLTFDDQTSKKVEMASPSATKGNGQNGNVMNRVDKFLHKLKTDVSGKINKSLSTKNERVMLVKAVQNTELSMGKLCTDQSFIVRNKLNGPSIENNNGNGVAPKTAKFLSDNSSDSGYEEIQDQNQKNMQPSVCELLLRCPETLDQPMASPNSDSDPTGNSHSVAKMKLSQTYTLSSMPALLVNSKPALISSNGGSMSASNSSVQPNLLVTSRPKDKDDQQKQRKSCLLKFY